MHTLASLISGRTPLTLPASATAMDAARAMAENRVGAVLVCDSSGSPLGIFTERDLMTRVVVARKDPERVHVSEVMTSELYTATPAERIADVRKELQRRHIRHLPVVEDGKVTAVLSLRDLLRAGLEETTFEIHELIEYIQRPLEESA